MIGKKRSKSEDSLKEFSYMMFFTVVIFTMFMGVPALMQPAPPYENMKFQNAEAFEIPPHVLYNFNPNVAVSMLIVPQFYDQNPFEKLFEIETYLPNAEASHLSNPTGTLPVYFSNDGARNSVDFTTPFGTDGFYVGHTTSGDFELFPFNVTSINLYMGNAGDLTSGTVQAVILSNVTGTNNFEDIVVEAVSLNSYDLTTLPDEGIITFDFNAHLIADTAGDIFYGFNFTGDGVNSFDIGSTDEAFNFAGDCIGVTHGIGNSWSDTACIADHLVMEVQIEYDSPITEWETSGGISPSNLVSYFTFDQEQRNPFVENNFNSSANAGTFGINSSAVTIVSGEVDESSLTTGMFGEALTVADPIYISSMYDSDQFDFLYDDVTDLWGISFWVLGSSFQSLTDYTPILNSMSSGEEHGIRIMVNATSQVVVDIGNDGGLIVENLGSTSTLDETTWTHIGLTVDKSDGTNTVRLYINGTQEAVTSADFSNGINTPPEAILGFRDSIATGLWSSKTAEITTFVIDDLGIWKDYQPSGTDMSNIYNGGTGATISSAVESGGGSPTSPVTNLTVTNRIDGKIVLQWDSFAGADGYRIYRTSTESGDTEQFFEGNVGNNFGTFASQSPFDGTVTSDWLTGTVTADFTGQIISEVVGRIGKSGTSELGGTIEAFVTSNGTSGSTIQADIVRSTTARDPQSFPTISTLEQASFFFKRDNVANLTSFNNDYGIGIGWFNRTSGTTSGMRGLEFGTSSGDSERYEWNGSQWVATGEDTARIRVFVVNQTKLQSGETPFISNTGSALTTYTDNSVIQDDHYWYRVEALSSGVPISTLSNVDDDFSDEKRVTGLITSVNNATGDITLSWNALPEASTYRIFRIDSIQDEELLYSTGGGVSTISLGKFQSPYSQAIQGNGIGSTQPIYPENPILVITRFQADFDLTNTFGDTSLNEIPIEIGIINDVETPIGSNPSGWDFIIQSDNSPLLGKNSDGFLNGYNHTFNQNTGVLVNQTTYPNWGFGARSNATNCGVPFGDYVVHVSPDETCQGKISASPATGGDVTSRGSVYTLLAGDMGGDVHTNSPSQDLADIRLYFLNFTKIEEGDITKILVNDTGTSSTMYVDMGTTFGSASYYTVAGLDSNGFQSMPSTFASGNTPATTPNAITNLSRQVNGTSCNLSWTEPSDGGADIVFYNIYRQINGGGFSVIDTVSVSQGTSFIDSSLSIATYQYDVRAVNGVGEGTSSNIVTCAITGSTDPPLAVTDLDSSASGTDIVLTWTEPVGNPTGYQIDRKIGSEGAFDTIVVNTGNSLTTYTDTTVQAGVTYIYRIFALNPFGVSPESNPTTTMALSSPTSPTLTVVQNIDQIDLSWTTPQSDNPINGFKIARRVNGGAFTTFVANTTTTNTTFTDTNVIAGNTYGYRVRALSASGEGAVSNVVDVVFGSHVVVKVREQDGSGFKGGGSVKLFNTTTVGNSTVVDFQLVKQLNSQSNAVFDNIPVGNYNYTFIDLDSFVLNKTFNFPFPSANLTSMFTINALVFDVDCPSNGGGTDVRIKLNYTNTQDIKSFPATPVCDNSDKVSWSTTWTGDPSSDFSKMVADFISPLFRANADNFLAGLIPISTSYDQGLNRILSSAFPVVTTSDVTINFDLFLGNAPPSGGETGSSGSGTSGGIPAPPSQQVTIVQEGRLTGLSLLSRTHQFVNIGDVIEGIITVQWNGELPLTVKRLEVGENSNLIRFDLPPFPVTQTQFGVGEFGISEGEIDYVITLPPFFCDPETGLAQNCVPEDLINIPVRITFEQEGVEYLAETEIFVDLRPIPLDIVQIQIIILGVVIIISALAGNAIRKRLKPETRRKKKQTKKFKKKFDRS